MKDTLTSIIEDYLMQGRSYEEFCIEQTGIKKKRWIDTAYRMRNRGDLPPVERLPDITEVLNDTPLKAAVVSEKSIEEIKALKASNLSLRRGIVSLYDVVENINEGLKTLPALKVKRPTASASSKPKSTLIIPLYDIHIGHLVEGPFGTYNEEEFENRCRHFTSQLLNEIKGLRASRNLERCIIIMGGDIIEGRTIFNGQARESAPLSFQLVKGPELMAQLIFAPIAAEFNEVEVMRVPGNHGRIGDRGEFDKVEDNLDMIFCHILELRTAGIKHLQWHDSDGWFNFFDLYGFKYFVAHGDGFKSWNGTPIYGASKYKEKLEDILKNKIDVLICGHHHTPAEWMKGYSRLVLMNNWVGTNSYSSAMALGGPASQRVIVADENNPVSIQYDFMLVKNNKPFSIEPKKIGR